jgi:hypothetical protein
VDVVREIGIRIPEIRDQMSGGKRKRSAIGSQREKKVRGV